MLHAALQRVVVAEEEALREVHHGEQAQTVVLEVLENRGIPAETNVFFALEREQRFELVLGGAIDFERDHLGVLFEVR